jgi:thiol-disulfide isomerase/thioredoxin
MRKLFFLSIFIFQFTQSYSQNDSIKPLSIGDKMPDILLSNFLDNSKPVRMSDLKGKLVIFDLWNTWCTACVNLMPSLDTLQKNFGDSIKIFLVTDSKRADVEKLFKRVKFKIPELQNITDDILINKLFPHLTVPQQVWIDKDRKVKFITNGYNATTDNIRAVLNNKSLELHEIKETAGFNMDQSLLNEGAGRLLYHLKYYSFFMNRLNEYEGTFTSLNRIDSVSKTITTKLVNQPLLNFYKTAFGISIPDGLTDLYSKELSDKRIIIEVKDPTKFHEPSDNSKKDHWFSQNTFSYESCIPIEDPDTSYYILQQDLNRYFPYSARIEKRKVRCFVLKRISDEDKLLTHSKNAGLMIDKNRIRIQNFPVSSFVSVLSNSYKEIIIPIVDGTGYKKNIDITITQKISDINHLNKNLKEYGLKLIEETRYIKMLVIADKN